MNHMTNDKNNNNLLISKINKAVKENWTDLWQGDKNDLIT